MDKVQQIEQEIQTLSPEEFAEFRQWFDEFAADLWDKQIEADVRAGKFDAMGKRALDDLANGRCTPL